MMISKKTNQLTSKEGQNNEATGEGKGVAMSTRATIKFADKYEAYYVYRHSDGFPKNVLKDIKEVIDHKNGCWSGSECGVLVSCFLGMHYNREDRLPTYEMTSGFHGDESYCYNVDWDGAKWTARVINHGRVS